MKRLGTGRIITFYSYKGGTGRSMLLANVAWILASHGRRVLAVDWDLEAPGLHRYFCPFLLDKDLASTPGLIDLVGKVYAMMLTRDREFGSSSESEFFFKPGDEWFYDKSDLTHYVVSLRRDDFQYGGVLDFLPAGRQGASYAARVNTFEWRRFYERMQGKRFFDALRKRMKEDYDYVLIDSRTGVSDTSGICTVQMPDDLVVCFTLNHQSIKGAFAVAASVREQRQKKEFRIFPVPARVDRNEKERLDSAREEAEKSFAPFVESLGETGDIDSYWAEVEVPYWPFYAFEEILAPFGDRPDKLDSLSAAALRLTARLTNTKVQRLPELSPSLREKYLDKFLRRPEGHELKTEGEAEQKVQVLERKQRLYRLASNTMGAVVLLSVLFAVGWRVWLEDFSAGLQYQINRTARKLVQGLGTDDKALRALAVSQVRWNNPQEVNTILTRIGERQSKAMAMIEVGVAWFIAGQPDRARQSLGQAASLVVGLPQQARFEERIIGLYFLPLAYARIGETERARKLLADAAKQLKNRETDSRKQADVGVVLALAWRELGETRDPPVSLAEAVALLKPADAEDQRRLVQVWAWAGEISQAESVARSIPDVADRGRALTFAALASIASRNKEKARSILDEIRSLEKRGGTTGQAEAEKSDARKGQLPFTGQDLYEQFAQQQQHRTPPSTAPKTQALEQKVAPSAKNVSPITFALTRLGSAYALLGEKGEAEAALEEAEQAAQTITDNMGKQTALAEVSVAWAQAGWGDRGERIASQLEVSPRKQEALGELAIARAREGTLEQAEILLSQVADTSLRARVLETIALAWVHRGELKRAGEVAGQQSDDSRKLETYARVLSAWKARSDSRWADYDARRQRSQTWQEIMWPSELEELPFRLPGGQLSTVW